MNRYRRHLIESGTAREDVRLQEIATQGAFTTRVFGQSGKIAGRRYEMNARGDGFDPLACRSPWSPECDTPPTLHNVTYGRVGLGAPIVLDHLATRPRLP